jgi:hypothetical protein
MKIHPLTTLAFAALLPHFGQAQTVVRTYKSETAFKGLDEIILNDEGVKNLPTGQYVFTLYSPENNIVSSQIITKKNL